MTALLDTNILSELRKPQSRANAGVLDWARSQHADTLSISVITVMEIEVGIKRLERRDPEQAERLHGWLRTDVLTAFERRTLPVDLVVARRAAQLHVPDPRPERDCLIAATALVHDLTVVTRNVRDFEPLGVRVLNPWADQPAR